MCSKRGEDVSSRSSRFAETNIRSHHINGIHIARIGETYSLVPHHTRRGTPNSHTLSCSIKPLASGMVAHDTQRMSLQHTLHFSLSV